MTILDQVNTKAEAEAPLERVTSCTDVQTALPPARTRRTNEQSMGRAVKLGMLIGIPATFLATFLIGFLGGAGLGASAAIGLWVGVFGSGTYLGGIFFLPSGPDSTGHDAK
jgi:hypothetical protein